MNYVVWFFFFCLVSVGSVGDGVVFVMVMLYFGVCFVCKLRVCFLDEMLFGVIWGYYMFVFFVCICYVVCERVF